MRTNHYSLIGIFVLFSIFPISHIDSQNRGLRYRLVNSVDVIAGADFGARTIKLMPEFTDSTHFLDNREFNERTKVNYRFGLNYVHGLTGSLSAKIGVRYANAGFTISKISRIRDLDTDVHILERVDRSSATSYVIYSYNFNFVEVPLAIRHTAVNSTCQPYIEFGLSTYLYLGTRIHEQFYQSLENKDGKFEMQKTRKNIYPVKQDFNLFNFLPYIAIGGNFNIHRNFSGFSQIILRKQVNNLRKNYVEEKLVSLGGEIGVRYYLEVY